MLEVDLIKQASAIKTLYDEACQTPFPYQGIRRLLKEAGAKYDGLIPDLDLHFSTIAGYCSWGKRLLNWDTEKVGEAMASLERGFFDKHPEYKPLESMITQQELVTKLSIYETMRVELLHLLKRLQEGRAN